MSEPKFYPDQEEEEDTKRKSERSEAPSERKRPASTNEESKSTNANHDEFARRYHKKHSDGLESPRYVARPALYEDFQATREHAGRADHQDEIKKDYKKHVMYQYRRRGLQEDHGIEELQSLRHPTTCRDIESTGQDQSEVPAGNRAGVEPTSPCAEHVSVGAIAVDGSQSDEESNDESSLWGEDNGRTVVANAVTEDDILERVREEFRTNAVVGEVIRHKKFWTKRRIWITVIVLLLASTGIVIGTTVARVTGATGNEDEEDSGYLLQVGQTLTGKSEHDLFGMSVTTSADGFIIAAGAPSIDFVNSTRSHAGYVRAFRLHENTGRWEPMGSSITHGQVIDGFGSSIDLSDDGMLLAVGSPLAGAENVRMYKWNGTGWQEDGLLVGEGAGDAFGWSVAVSADSNIVACGAAFSNSTGMNSGYVRVYQRSASQWQQLGPEISGEAGDFAGDSLALSNDGLTLAVGSPQMNISDIQGPGLVRVFRFDGKEWIQKGQDIVGIRMGDQLGQSVSLSGDGKIVACGEPYNDETFENAGRVLVFRLNGNLWEPMGSPILGEMAEDNFGTKVALSESGKRLIASSPVAHSDTGAGRFRIFSFTDGDWKQFGSSIEGAGSNDVFGLSAMISADGSLVSVGDPTGDVDGAANSGRVQTFLLV